MDIALITSGIKAIIRAAQAGIDIYVEHTLDKPIFLPNIRLPAESMADKITVLLQANNALKTQAPFAEGWDAQIGKWNAKSLINMQDCIAKYLELSSVADLQNRSPEVKNQLIGGRMIEQWRASNKPPSVWAKVALTLTDIALEFVATTPSIMGEQSKGEKLVVAFAQTLSDLIPDDTEEFGAAHDLGNRLLGIFLRAGLKTLADDDGAIIAKEHVRALVIGIIKPVTEKLPENFNELFKYQEIVETLVSESAAAALSIISAKTDVYFGDKFVNDKALGAVTQALLATTAQATKENNILKVFSKQSIKTLFESALTVAIEKPDLFVKDGAGGDNHQLLIDLFVGSSETIKQANTKGFNKEIGVSFISMVIKTVGQNADALLKINPAKPWNEVALKIIQDITDGLGEAVAKNERFNLFSQEQQHRFGLVILEQISETPTMLGANDAELKKVISAVASAMAEDNNFLISNEEWIQIAAIAAGAAASDPAKLFNIDADNNAEKLGMVVIKSFLTAANDAWKNTKNTPIKGYTLASAIKIVIDTLKDNITGVKNNPQAINDYIQRLKDKVIQNPDEWGSKAILKFISDTIESVLATGTLPEKLN